MTLETSDQPGTGIEPFAVDVPTVIAGELIEAAWGNQVRTDLIEHEAGILARLPLAGGRMTGILYMGSINYQVGTGSQLDVNARFSSASHIHGSTNMLLIRRGTSGEAGDAGQQYVVFQRSASQTTPNDVTIGSITINPTVNGVMYNTTSDHRLKDVVGDVADPVGRLAALRPRRLRWKTAPDTEFDGFLAHEVADVVPQAVTGVKDAVLPADTDIGTPGDIDPQQLDASQLVPLLVAAVQTLTARVATLEAGAP